MSRVRPGFSLLELIIVTSIASIVVAAALASFATFQDRQRGLVAAKDIQQVFRSAQTKARVREKPPSGCATLLSYQVVIDGQNVRLNRVCNDGSTTLKTLLVPSDSVITPASATFTFPTLEGTVTSTTSLPSNITVVSSGKAFQFSVTQTGVISTVIDPSNSVKY